MDSYSTQPLLYASVVRGAASDVNGKALPHSTVLDTFDGWLNYGPSSLPIAQSCVTGYGNFTSASDLSIYETNLGSLPCGLIGRSLLASS